MLMVRLENDIKKNPYRFNTDDIFDTMIVLYSERRSYMAEAGYLLAQAVLFCISAASSLIICNINLKLTTTLFRPDSLAFLRIPVAGIATLPAILYYIYSLNGLPDRMLRTYGLAQRVNQYQVWGLLGLVYIVGLGSCGNLLYSGLTADFSRLLSSFEGESLILGTVGGAISSLCNIFALLKIFEDHVKTKLPQEDSERFEALESKLEELVAQARQATQTMEGGYSGVNPSTSHNTDNEEGQEEVDLTEVKEQIQKSFVPFFQHVFSCEKEKLYVPLLNAV
ncbi:MAG: hypothetical protein LRY69_05630 [Gammaproteobacteria bacterium]|nr:hypothetical protein [Gammaproteobacteria bacterium]